MLYPTVIVITGPTGSGKSALAMNVARALGCDIISADSRQIYRDIPITTAAPTAADLVEVRHHFVGTLALDQYYSASRYEQEVMALLPTLQTQYVVICGGSMMYVDAVLNGIDDMPTVSPEVRHRVLHDFNTMGPEYLRQQLLSLDEYTYNHIDLNNTRRVIHAVEVSIQGGKPYSSFCTHSRRERPFHSIKFMINHERHTLFDRINRRVDAMVDAGMEDEARRMYPLRHLNSLNTVGFKEWFAHFDGRMDRDTTIARIAKNTRVYAKKQLTWLAKSPDVIALDPDGNMTRRVLELVGSTR